MFNNLANSEKNERNISGIQLLHGKLTYDDIDSRFVLRKEEKLKKTHEHAHLIYKMIESFKEIELEYAKKHVKHIFDNFYSRWPSLFDNDFSHEYIYVYIDIDAFYASVENLIEPVNGPMAIGSMSMLAASNYKARKYGVKAGMPGYQGKALCPHLIIRPAKFEMYNLFSDRVLGLLTKFDPNIGIFGMDECCLTFDAGKMRNGFKFFCEYENGAKCIFCNQTQINSHNFDFKFSTNSFQDNNKNTQNLNKKFAKSNNDVISDLSLDEIILDSSSLNIDDSQELKKLISSQSSLNCSPIKANNKILTNQLEFKRIDSKKLKYNKQYENNINKKECYRSYNSEYHSSHISDCEKIPFTFENVEKLMHQIRSLVYETTGLTISAGISICRGVSKLCAGINKPNNQFLLRNNIQQYLRPLKSTKINGIGSKTEILLKKGFGIHTIAELQDNLHLIFLVFKTKTFYNLMKMAYGLSQFDSISTSFNPVPENLLPRKGFFKDICISKSKTFLPTNNHRIILEFLWFLSENLSRKIQSGQAALVTLTVKTSLFKRITKQIPRVVRTDIQIFNTCVDLLYDSLKELCPVNRPAASFCNGCKYPSKIPNHQLQIRLLGISLSRFSHKNPMFDRYMNEINPFKCFICNSIFINTSFKFFNGHVNSCLDWQERKNRTNLLQFFVVKQK